MSNDPRIDRLEERLAWLERHVSEQDRAMLELAEENARLKKSLVQLHARVAATPAQLDSLENADEEKPPHY